MKVLLVNGSPHKEGCTYMALCEVSKTLNENGIDTDFSGLETKLCPAVSRVKNVLIVTDVYSMMP